MLTKILKVEIINEVYFFTIEKQIQVKIFVSEAVKIVGR